MARMRGREVRRRRTVGSRAVIVVDVDCGL